MARCNLERHLSDSDFQLVFEVRPKNVVVVPLLSFGKNLFADVRAGDGMIGEIIIEKKGTIVFFFYPIGDCARPSKRLSEDWRHLSLLPKNRGSI